MPPVLAAALEPRVADGTLRVYDTPNHTHGELVRTNIDIDDDLMAAALEAARRKTKKATVEEALRLLVRTRAQGRLRELRGKLHWEGSLEELRRDR